MFGGTSVEVLREVDATLIPTGDKVTLKPGSLVYVTQALGTSYTVHINGNLVRIAGKDGDAIGLVKLVTPDINASEGTVSDKVWTQLKTCFDPEIPVNIVDLGLVYDCGIQVLENNLFHVDITMTLTAPGCGMGPVLVSEIIEKIREINQVADAKVELVFDPPWQREMMTDEAKLQLGLF